MKIIKSPIRSLQTSLPISPKVASRSGGKESLRISIIRTRRRKGWLKALSFARKTISFRRKENTYGKNAGRLKQESQRGKGGGRKSITSAERVICTPTFNPKERRGKGKALGKNPIFPLKIGGLNGPLRSWTEAWGESHE